MGLLFLGFDLEHSANSVTLKGLGLEANVDNSDRAFSYQDMNLETDMLDLSHDAESLPMSKAVMPVSSKKNTLNIPPSIVYSKCSVTYL